MNGTDWRSGRSKDGKVSVEKGGNRGGEADKRAGVHKSGKLLGARNKVGQRNTPAKGLVFGPVRGEPGGVVAGKRLRVESDIIGRAGGAYTSACTRSPRELGLLSSKEGLGEMIGALPASSSTSVDIVLQGRTAENGDTSAEA